MDTFSSSEWLLDLEMEMEEFTPATHQNQILLRDIIHAKITSADLSNKVVEITSADLPNKVAKITSADHGNWNSSNNLASSQMTSKNNYFPKGEQVIISFGNTELEYQMEDTQAPYNEEDYDAVALALKYHDQSGARKRAEYKKRSPPFAQDHVLAERKRREKITKRFLALTALIPGLKKMDKASIIEEASAYIKTLQARVKTLEDQVTRENSESTDSKLNNQSTLEDGSSSSYVNCDGMTSFTDFQVKPLELEVIGKAILIRVIAKDNEKIMPMILQEIKKLNLTPGNRGGMLIDEEYVNVTVVAQIKGELEMTLEETVKSLRKSLERNLFA